MKLVRSPCSQIKDAFEFGGCLRNPFAHFLLIFPPLSRQESPQPWCSCRAGLPKPRPSS